MAKSIMDKFNAPAAKEQFKPTPAEAIKCKANNCPEHGSVNLGGDSWLCSYHAKGTDFQWPHITKMLNENKRYLHIRHVIQQLRIDEYEAMRDAGTCQLHELLVPVEGEDHPAWIHRVKQTIHKALMHKTHQIIEDHAYRSGKTQVGVTKAVAELTSGMLLKPVAQSKALQHAEGF